MTEKQYIADNKTLMLEWDFDENHTLDPKKLTKGSNKKASWKCSKCNHKWKTTIYHRAIKETGCPNCYHSKRVNYNSKENIKITHPEIAKNWHPTKNKNLTPDMFTRGSRFKAFWVCHTCGKEWDQSINNYKPCTYCKNRAKLAKNSLKERFPELSKEWSYAKNKDLSPKDILHSSSRKVWWTCSICNHDWQAKLSNRTYLGRGCPLCANKVVVAGKNDLATTHPHLANEWHFKKNGEMTPKNITYGSGKIACWRCPVGHEYKATILHRAHGTDCPKCNSGRQTSFAEQATYFYVKKLYPEAISRYTASFLGKMELDIYIPSIKYAIEYDGEAWHKKESISREKLKYLKCKEKGIKLIRLREKMPELCNYSADYQFSAEKLYEPKNLEIILVELLKRINFSSTWMIKCPIDINIERDKVEIQQYRTKIKKDSLFEKFPAIAREWHPLKNENLTPDMFKPYSSQKVWWLCSSCGFEYESTIGHRADGTGCPKCAIEKVTKVKRKPVNMIDPNNGNIISTFISISEASRQMKINSSNISMVCKGQRPKAGGYFWAYETI
jgi:Zn finger protein HypA/HybF involved in hydrogenase expression